MSIIQSRPCNVLIVHTLACFLPAPALEAGKGAGAAFLVPAAFGGYHGEEQSANCSISKRLREAQGHRHISSHVTSLVLGRNDGVRTVACLHTAHALR